MSPEYHDTARCHQSVSITVSADLSRLPRIEFSLATYYMLGEYLMPHYNVNPTDGALFANGHSVEKHHREAWKTETERIQRLRGETLSAVFAIESSIDYAIGDSVLPRQTTRSKGALVKRHLLFQNEIVTRFDFRTKIEILGSIISQRFPRKKADITRLISLLNQIRDVRNRMAHAPVYFEALPKKVSGRWLRPHLMTAKGMTHLSDGYFREFRNNVLSALNQLQRIMRIGIKTKPHGIWA